MSADYRSLPTAWLHCIGPIIVQHSWEVLAQTPVHSLATNWEAVPDQATFDTSPSSRHRHRQYRKQADLSEIQNGSVAKSGWLVTCLRDLERGVEA